jgi:hypothetical protein
MVKAAQRHEVRCLGLAAMRPVSNVIRINVARVRAARESAAAIARIERTPQRARNAPSSSANIQRLVLLVLDNRHEAAIACKAPNGLSGHRRAFVDLTSAGDAIAKRLCINVYDDLVALAATQRLAAVLEISLSKRAERIGASSRTTWALIG